MSRTGRNSIKTKKLRRRFNSVLEEVTYPNENSIWAASSDYEITWSGDFAEENSIQILLYRDEELYGSLVSSTLNDGSVFCQLDSAVPTSDTYRVQIALLPEKETVIWSDSFLINEIDSSSNSLVTTAGIILYIVTFGVVLYVAYTFNQWRKKHPEGAIHALKNTVQQSFAQSPFSPSFVRSPNASFRFGTTKKKKKSRNSDLRKVIPTEEYKKVDTASSSFREVKEFEEADPSGEEFEMTSLSSENRADPS